MKEQLIYFESLGCDKNLVDSEVMIGMLNQAGYQITMDPMAADGIVINTCSFISDAKQESVDTILKYAELKHTGKLKALLVVGCLTELYRDEVMKEIEEVDGVLGAANNNRILEAIEETLGGNKYVNFEASTVLDASYLNRTTETTKQYTYLKIAEGCDNHCTYCIIPKLRGQFRSRSMDSILEEVKHLVELGKTEFILVAQDVGKYGMDLYGESRLPELIQAIAAVDGVHWIRLLYVYPEDITDALIDVMATEDKVVHYIDMPLQHADDMILKRMARKSRLEGIESIIDKLRRAMPDICIRTTFIVGFPGETDEAFNNLYKFVKRMRLDRIGVFTYSREEGTPAYDMPNQIDEATMLVRQEKIMLLQQQISLEKNQDMISKTLEVMIEAYVPADNVYMARSYKDTPDVDGYVFVESEEDLLSGDYINVKIVQANEYDLIGERI